MKRVMIVLAVLALSIPAMGGEIGFLTRQNYAEIGLSLDDFTPLDEVFGLRTSVIAAVTYDTPQSQPLKNLEIDLGDNFVGVSIRKDLLSGPVTPYVAYKPMVRNSTLSDWYHVLVVGVDGLEITKNISIGVEWQTCRERGDEDLHDGNLMASVAIRW